MKKGPITREMTIGEVVDRYPAAAEVLVGNGMRCAGCGARFVETIERGLKEHGMTDRQVCRVLAQMNEAARRVITVTRKASERLMEILKREKKQGYCLRVQAMKGRYGLDFEKEGRKGDTIVECSGLKFLIGAKAMPKVRGAKIDWIESPVPGFSITGPKRK